MKKAFTLIEMLVVIGIIAILMAAVISAVSRMTRVADRARCQELISNTSTAMLALFQQEGAWPRALIRNHNAENGLDQSAALPLAKGGYMSLSVQVDAAGKVTALNGYNRFGIISPWATQRIKSNGKNVSLSSRVPTGGTIADHVLRYALDLDGDGIIKGMNVGGQSIDIRATAAVWCIGKDGGNPAGQGDPWPYREGLKRGDIYSWGSRQVENE